MHEETMGPQKSLMHEDAEDSSLEESGSAGTPERTRLLLLPDQIAILATGDPHGRWFGTQNFSIGALSTGSFPAGFSITFWHAAGFLITFMLTRMAVC
jgi:hypothetical protein